MSIFTHSDPILFLKDAYEAKKKKNKRFSLRAWARELGLVEATPLVQVLKNKRPIPHHYVPRIVRSLKLSSTESQYFETLVLLKNSKSAFEKEHWTKLAQSLHRKARFRVSEVEDFSLFQSPLMMVLLELVQLKGFKEEASWILGHLEIESTVVEIKDAFESLIAGGYLKRDLKGRLKRTEQHITSQQDVSSLWIKKFHESALKQAAQAVYSQDLDSREYGSYVFSINLKDLPEMKRVIRRFTSNVISKYSERANPGNAIYQFNVNLFSQTKKEQVVS